jgi:hypothetical protein
MLFRASDVGEDSNFQLELMLFAAGGAFRPDFQALSANIILHSAYKAFLPTTL